MNEVRTVDSIMKYLEDTVTNKLPVPPSMWLECSQLLNVLRGNEDDALAELCLVLANERVKLIDSGKSVSEARTRVEASPFYADMQKQKAKIERIIELIRIAKLRSRLADEEYKAS